MGVGRLHKYWLEPGAPFFSDLGEFDHRFRTPMSTLAFANGPKSSALPIVPQSVSRGARFSRLRCGIGPIISSAMVAAIGTGDVFSKGRDFGAWLGLVPKQISTGDRTILGSISRRGNRHPRVLFVQAAWVVLVKLGPKHWERHGLKSWIEAAKKRLHYTCSPLRWPTSSPASRGRFSTRGAPSRASRAMKPRPNPLKRRAVLGAVKTRPGSTDARGEACATTSLDGSLRAARPHAQRSGRRNGRQARTKEQRKTRSYR